MSCKKECNPIWFVRREKMNLEFINNESSPSGDEGGHQSLEKDIQKGDGHPSSSSSSSSTTVTSNNNDPISDDEMEIIFEHARTVKPLEPETEDNDNLTMTKPEIACDDSKLTDEKMKYEYCPNCFKKFLKVDRLMAHRKICHLQVNRPVHLKSVSSSSSLPVVNSKNSPPPQEASVQRYFCKLCSRSFKQKTDLGSHLQRHLDKKLPVCHCNKAFTNHRYLLEHKRRHHHNEHTNSTNNISKTINCSSSGSSSSSKISGRKQSSTSTFRLGYKHYLCHRPKKSSKSGGQPKRRFLHAKFSCLVCAKKFKTEQKDEFSKHMKSHSRYRDTSKICKVCGMFFNGQQSLVHHLNNHSQWMATLNNQNKS